MSKASEVYGDNFLVEKDGHNSDPESYEANSYPVDETEIKKWLGIVVFKIRSGITILGIVVDGEEENDLYKVAFDDGVNLLLDIITELKRMLVKPIKYDECGRYADIDFLRKEGDDQKKAAEHEGRSEKKENGAGASAATKDKKLARKQYKEELAAAREGRYVPLAIREKKKDEYVWW